MDRILFVSETPLCFDTSRSVKYSQRHDTYEMHGYELRGTLAAHLKQFSNRTGRVQVCFSQNTDCLKAVSNSPGPISRTTASIETAKNVS